MSASREEVGISGFYLLRGLLLGCTLLGVGRDRLIGISPVSRSLFFKANTSKVLVFMSVTTIADLTHFTLTEVFQSARTHKSRPLALYRAVLSSRPRGTHNTMGVEL